MSGLNEEQKQLIKKAYIDEKRGQAYCAKIAHTSVYTVKKFLKAEGISIRSYSEAAILSNKNRKKYHINEEYFNTQTPDMVYLLGFLAADGSIAKRGNSIKIGLSQVDYDFLEEINRKLDSNYPIKKYTNNRGYECCSLTFTSEHIKNQLANFNIVPQKTFSFEIPNNLKPEYFNDFLRGYFDGDGCVSTAGPNAIRWSICSANRKNMEIIVNYLFDNYNIPKVAIQARNSKSGNGHILYYIQYSTSATKKLFNILYYNNCFCLPRKFEKYKKIISD